jgi:hypothetical protein
LGAHLQRLKLVLSLEAFALQQQLAAAGSNGSAGSTKAAAAVVRLLAKQQQVKQQQVLAAGAGYEGGLLEDDAIFTAPAAADAASLNTTLGSVRTASSGLSSSSTSAETCPSSSGDDTRAVADAQQQQQNAAQLAAQQVRLKTLQHMMAAVDSMLAILPAAAAAPTSLSSGSTSPRGNSQPNPSQQQQQQQRGVVVAAQGSSTAGGASGSWGLLGGLLARHSTDSHLHPSEDTLHPHSLQQQQHRLFGRRSGGRSDGTGSDSSPAALPAAVQEEVLAAYITPSMLSSLAAVTKLFVGASSLSGQQQEQQQGAVGDGGCGSTAHWAEQEHALMLMKGILKVGGIWFTSVFLGIACQWRKHMRAVSLHFACGLGALWLLALPYQLPSVPSAKRNMTAFCHFLCCVPCTDPVHIAGSRTAGRRRSGQQECAAPAPPAAAGHPAGP